MTMKWKKVMNTCFFFGVIVLLMREGILYGH